ncbi:hypothetical protein D5S18_19930 [Nocardia panacis]|uniref:Uncharacterized protein n=1 Tax=Nocardia panacis TaxID=2340916 RepID=A0A3A4KDD7_9NOCA|nr:hypothetical protein D5S18_19930 [Nocardia panacis]
MPTATLSVHDIRAPPRAAKWSDQYSKSTDRYDQGVRPTADTRDAPTDRPLGSRVAEPKSRTRPRHPIEPVAATHG